MTNVLSSFVKPSIINTCNFLKNKTRQYNSKLI